MMLSIFYDHLITASEQTGLSLDEIAKQCTNAGITGLEIANTALNEQSRENLNVLKSCGMTVNSLPAYCDFLHDPSTDFADEVLKEALEIGAKIILVIPGFLEENEDREATMLRSVFAVSYLCDIAEKHGIKVGIEEYDNSRVPLLNTRELLWYIDRIPKLSCVFDTGNFFYTGEDTMEAYHALKPHITAQIHLKDRSLEPCECDAEQYRQDGTRMYPAAVGSGCIPIRPILKDLVKSGFDGSVSIELYGSADCLGDMKRSADYIKGILSSCN